MHLIGRRLSFSLNGQQVELEASPGETLRAFFGAREGRPILRVLSYLGSTPAVGPARCLSYDGIGWTLEELCSIAELRERQMDPQSGARPSNSDEESSHTFSDGNVAMIERAWEKKPSSIMTEPQSKNCDGLGQLHAAFLEYGPLRTTSAEPEPQS